MHENLLWENFSQLDSVRVRENHGQPGTRFALCRALVDRRFLCLSQKGQKRANNGVLLIRQEKRVPYVCIRTCALRNCVAHKAGKGCNFLLKATQVIEFKVDAFCDSRRERDVLPRLYCVANKAKDESQFRGGCGADTMDS